MCVVPAPALDMLYIYLLSVRKQATHYTLPIGSCFTQLERRYFLVVLPVSGHVISISRWRTAKRCFQELLAVVHQRCLRPGLIYHQVVSVWSVQGTSAATSSVWRAFGCGPLVARQFPVIPSPVIHLRILTLVIHRWYVAARHVQQHHLRRPFFVRNCGRAQSILRSAKAWRDKHFQSSVGP